MRKLQFRKFLQIFKKFCKFHLNSFFFENWKFLCILKGYLKFSRRLIQFSKHCSLQRFKWRTLTYICWHTRSLQQKASPLARNFPSREFKKIKVRQHRRFCLRTPRSITFSIFTRMFCEIVRVVVHGRTPGRDWGPNDMV